MTPPAPRRESDQYDVDAGSVEAGGEIWPMFSTVVDEGEQN